MLTLVLAFLLGSRGTAGTWLAPFAGNHFCDDCLDWHGFNLVGRTAALATGRGSARTGSTLSECCAKFCQVSQRRFRVYTEEQIRGVVNESSKEFGFQRILARKRVFPSIFAVRSVIYLV